MKNSEMVPEFEGLSKKEISEIIANFSDEELKAYLEKTKPKIELITISITFPYPLNSSAIDKLNDCSEWHTWTAFVNNAGTLVHVVNRYTGDWYRLQFYYPMKTYSPNHMRKMIYNRLSFLNLEMEDI